MHINNKIADHSGLTRTQSSNIPCSNFTSIWLLIITYCIYKLQTTYSMNQCLRQWDRIRIGEWIRVWFLYFLFTSNMDNWEATMFSTGKPELTWLIDKMQLQRSNAMLCCWGRRNDYLSKTTKVSLPELFITKMYPGSDVPLLVKITDWAPQGAHWLRDLAIKEVALG